MEPVEYWVIIKQRLFWCKAGERKNTLLCVNKDLSCRLRDYGAIQFIYGQQIRIIKSMYQSDGYESQCMTFEMVNIHNIVI